MALEVLVGGLYEDGITPMNPVATQVYLVISGVHIYWMAYGDERQNLDYLNITVAAHESLELEVSVWFMTEHESFWLDKTFILKRTAFNEEDQVGGFNPDPAGLQYQVPI
jgi:hypothetical protein